MNCAIIVVVAMAAGVEAEVSAESKAQAQERAQQGWTFWQQRQYRPAETAFAAAVELDPGNTHAWNGLGWSRFNGGKPDEAVKAFQKCVALDPSHAAALNGLGQIAFSQREYDKAEQYFLQAEGASAAWHGLTRLYLLRGKFQDAEKWAQRVLGQEPGNELAQQMLAAAKAGKLDDALREQIEPPPVKGAKGNAKRPKGLKATSAESKEGWAMFQQGNPKGAAEKFRAALKDNPNELSAHNGLGFALLNLGEAAEAKQHFEFCLKHDPKAAGPLNGMARCQMAEGDLDGAIKSWEKMDRLPGVGPIHAGTYGLAEAYTAKGEHKKAVAQYEKIAKAEPNNQQIQTKLMEARAKAAP